MSEVRRTSFAFPKDATARLAAIRSKTYLENDADVIRLALSVLDSLLNLIGVGCKIVIHDSAGKNWPYSPFVRSPYPDLQSEPSLDGRDGETRSVAKNFFFSGEAVDRLVAIREKTDFRTNADVIRLALVTLDHLLTVDMNGDEIIARDCEGQDCLFSIFDPQGRSSICTRVKAAAAPI
jgi:hypothetical protein